MTNRTHSTRGFTFLELMVVMGAMAVLMGLAVGFLGSVGQATILAQSRAIVVETARKCQNASVGGGRRAVFILQTHTTDEGDEVLQVAASIAAPVLTHQFETVTEVSGKMIAQAQGVEIARNAGYTGHAGKFTRGAFLELPAQSKFAMTDGFELDVYLKPEGGPQRMLLLAGKGDADDVYRVSLVRSHGAEAYDVQVMLRTLPHGANARLESPTSLVFETKGGALAVGADWQRLQVGYDGLDASIRVDGRELLPQGADSVRRDGGVDAAAQDRLRRIAAPPSGAVRLFISGAAGSYVGLMDGLNLRGVFRSDEMQRTMPEMLKLDRPPLPVRVVYRNGVLDPDVHRDDVLLRFRDELTPEDLPLTVLLGRNGTIESRQEATAAEPQRTPASTTSGGDQ